MTILLDRLFGSPRERIGSNELLDVRPFLFLCVLGELEIIVQVCRGLKGFKKESLCPSQPVSKSLLDRETRLILLMADLSKREYFPH